MFFPLLASLFGSLLPLAETPSKSWWGDRWKKNGAGSSGFSDVAFQFVKPHYYVQLVVQSNLHTLVILSFTEEFRTIFQLRQKELEKLNRPTRRSIEFASCRFGKRTSWFLTMEDHKTVCLFYFQNI